MFFLNRKSLLLSFVVSLCVCQSATSFAEHRFHNPEAFIQSIEGKPDVGKKVYDAFCVNCHAVQPMIELKAPRIGVLNDWEPRMKKGLAEMLKKTSEGIKDMPAMGGCFECSDRDLMAAIAYMLPKKCTN